MQLVVGQFLVDFVVIGQGCIAGSFLIQLIEESQSN